MKSLTVSSFSKPMYVAAFLAVTWGLVTGRLWADSHGANLLEMITSQLKVSPDQAKGGVGSLLELAGGNMSAEDFAKVSAAIPDAFSLIKAAPVVESGNGLSLNSVTSGVAGLYRQFDALGLDADMAGKFATVMMDYLKTSGDGSVAKLFSSAVPTEVLKASGSVLDLL